MKRGIVVGLLAVGAASHVGCYFLVDTSGIVGGSSAPDAAPEGGVHEAGPAGDARDGTDGGPVDENGLVAHWSFDSETNGIVPDLTGLGHDGQLGTPAVLASGMDGGKALATSMTVDSLGGARFPPQGTLSFWLKADFTGSQVEGLQIFDSNDLSRSHLHIRVVNASSSVDFQVACQIAGQSRYPFADDFNPASNTWMHLVVEWDSVLHFAAVYLDGNLLEEGDGGALASWVPSAQLFVFASSFPNGLIDEARVYSRVLPASEVSVLP